MQKPDNKKIKDPVYGYLSIPSQYMKDIIDTPVFQRLRRVIQTSYSPLYASALHNRFAHSLGVFFLGSIVAKRLKKVIEQKQYLTTQIVEEYASTYKIACLLHDIGHAPFSHTGEVYYKNDNFQVLELHQRLCSLVSSYEFKKDLPGESSSAAPHEIMSAIVGIKEFGDIIGNDENKELFARCITGYKYAAVSKENEIKNCFICMLNSSVIDVDRLDYLIRDAYTSGFATVSIDYVRLLNALNIINYNNKYEIAYKKDAVSIIENVVYAHDAERKWIQNHPVVVYETYILKRILENLNKNLNKEKHRFFSEESLSQIGHKLKGGRKVCLLCDDDVIYLAKNVFPDQFSEEFFDRNKRRHPVWKSEAEYQAYIGGFSTGGEHKDRFMDCMEAFVESRVPDHIIPMKIDESLIKQFQEELVDAQKDKVSDDSKIGAIKRKLSACYYLEQYVKKRGIPFDFIIIPTYMFNSNFSKEHLGNTLVTFGKNEKAKQLKDVCNLLKSDIADRNFYYLFYRRGEPSKTSSGKIDNVADFCEGLFEAVVSSNRNKDFEST